MTDVILTRSHAPFLKVQILYVLSNKLKSPWQLKVLLKHMKKRFGLAGG